MAMLQTINVRRFHYTIHNDMLQASVDSDLYVDTDHNYVMFDYNANNGGQTSVILCKIGKDIRNAIDSGIDASGKHISGLTYADVIWATSNGFEVTGYHKTPAQN